MQPNPILGAVPVVIGCLCVGRCHMNNQRLFSLVLPLALPFAASAILLLIIGSLPTQAQNPTVHYVAPGGDCRGATLCYATVQAAVDATNPDGVIKAATGCRLRRIFGLDRRMVWASPAIRWQCGE